MYRPLILISIFLAACTSKPPRAENTPVAPALTATESICQPSPIQRSSITFPEIQAKMNSKGGEVWALLFFEEAHAREELKIVWRVVVSGPGTEIQVQAQHEEGTIIQPICGPEFHPESNWERPGTEWGTGFNFPEPGCWTIAMKAGSTEGEISLDVLDS